jgi:Domain of unknown function (DUF4440)
MITSRRRRARALTIAIAISAAATLGFASSADAEPARAPAGSRQTDGAKLADQFLELLRDKDAAGLRRFLSPAFQLQRADGTFATKAEYLKAPAVVEAYQIDNLRATRSGSVIVARYDLVVDSTIDGQKQSTAPAPRLSVFVKGPKGWQIVAHANFNTPVPPG